MALLTVRNLRPDVHQRLREQAARHGRSMEAEVRSILEVAVGAEHDDLASALHRFAEEAAMTEEEVAASFPPRRTDTARGVDFAERQ